MNQSAFAVIAFIAIFVSVGFSFGKAVYDQPDEGTGACVVSTHSLQQPFDGGVAYDTRITYEGTCSGIGGGF